MSIDSNILLTADRGHILKVLNSFSGKPTGQWLAAGHPAAKGSLPTKWNNVQNIPDQQLLEAVAASAPNHCLDGWSYAARALSALLAGDLHAARHLAYYAQLRAALSMLGHLGIGIFNGVNFVITSNGTVKPFETGPTFYGTHAAVWKSLKTWVTNPSAARQFLDLVRIGKSSLSNCIDAIWPGTSATSVAGKLIAAWGVDLQRGETEHVARNMSSYNPQAFEQIADQPSDRLNFVENVWKLFEPTSTGKFDRLDRSLLRSLLWQQHEILKPGVARSAGAIASRYDELPKNIQMIASKDFLLGITETRDPKLLRVARMTTSPSLPTEMVARALLLLRAATSFTVSNFSDAGVSIDAGKLRQWVDPLAVTRGFWKSTAALENPVDLWEDVRIALEDLATSKKNPAPKDLNEWVSKFPGGLPFISEAERIGIWSFGS